MTLVDDRRVIGVVRDVGVAARADTARAGGLVARAITLFTALIFFAAVFGIVATKLLLGAWPFSGDAAASLIASVGAEVNKAEETGNEEAQQALQFHRANK